MKENEEHFDTQKRHFYMHNTIQSQNQLEAARARMFGTRGSVVAMEAANIAAHDIPDGCLNSFFGIFTGYSGAYYAPGLALSLSSGYYDQSTVRREIPPNDTGEELLFESVNITPDFYLDKVHRHFLTGRIVLEGYDPKGLFHYIDLSGRNVIRGTEESIIQDEFLFRAVPLEFRTWYYQSMFEMENSVDALVKMWNDGQKPIRSLKSIRELVLSKPMSELPAWKSGLYSPSLVLLVAGIICCFSMDKTFFLLITSLWIISLTIASATNTCVTFGRERMITVVPRLALSAWICASRTDLYIDRHIPVSASVIPALLRLTCGVIILIDFVVSDLLQWIFGSSKKSKFVIRKIFEKNSRVLLCHATNSPRTEAQRLPKWIFENESDAHAENVHLIVDTEGLLFRLLPIRSKSDLPDPRKGKINFASIKLVE